MLLTFALFLFRQRRSKVNASIRQSPERDKRDKEITLEVLNKTAPRIVYLFTAQTIQRPSVYRKTMTSGVDEQWQADLVEMRNFSDSNEGYNYLLCVIDCTRE